MVGIVNGQPDWPLWYEMILSEPRDGYRVFVLRSVPSIRMIKVPVVITMDDQYWGSVEAEIDIDPDDPELLRMYVPGDLVSDEFLGREIQVWNYLCCPIPDSVKELNVAYQ